MSGVVTCVRDFVYFLIKQTRDSNSTKSIFVFFRGFFFFFFFLLIVLDSFVVYVSKVLALKGEISRFMGSSGARWCGAYMRLMKLSWCVYIRCTCNRVPRIQGLENCCQRCQPSNFFFCFLFLFDKTVIALLGNSPWHNPPMWFIELFFFFLSVHDCNFCTIYRIRLAMTRLWIVSHYRREGLIIDWEILALLGNFSRQKSFANQTRVQIMLLSQSLFGVHVQKAWPQFPKVPTFCVNGSRILQVWLAHSHSFWLMSPWLVALLFFLFL